VMNPADGEILAMVGSADYNNAAIRGQVNLTGMDPLGWRGVGSSFKVYTYAAALQAGLAARTVTEAVAYAHTREQFGQAIGAFQAVQHLCADMLARAELARVAVYAAAVSGDEGEIAGAKLLADDAAVQGARDCLQVHGGMGFTWEARVHRLLKRAWAWERTAADRERCLDVLAGHL